MKRREFIRLVGGAAAVWPLAARAQQPVRIGVLSIRAESDVDWRANIEMFQNRLQELGWTDGRNIQIDYRGGCGQC
jgi:putative ABC transport system substrate-binding protein